MAKSSGSSKGRRDRRPTGKKAQPAKPEMPGQVGKRPSNPSFLVLVGIMWVACGVASLFWLSASWKIIPTIFFVGVGLFFIRGAATTYLRHDERGSKG